MSEVTLTDFLLARIASEEKLARAAMGEPQYGGHYGDTAAEEVIGMGYNEGCRRRGMKHFERWMPARVLAECAAKRRIVELCRQGMEWRYASDGSREFLAEQALEQMASVFADHSDYRAEWGAE